MGRRFENLEDKEIIACYVSAYRENGLDDVEFEKLIAQMKSQKEEELIQLSQELEKLEISNKISDKDFERMARVYLTSQSENCSMREAEAIITKLDEEREAEDKSDYGKIAKNMRTPKPKYDIEKLDDEKPQKEKGKEEVEKLSGVEWIHACDIRLEQLKRKYRR